MSSSVRVAYPKQDHQISVIRKAMNEQGRTAFCSEPGEEPRRSAAAARLFNEVEGKISRLQPFDGLPNNATV